VPAVSAQPSPHRRDRPLPLTLAALLLYAVAGALVLLAVLAIAYFGSLRGAARTGYADRANADQLVSQVTTGALASIAGLVVLALALAVLATFNLQGSRIARIGSWIAAGVGALCCGGSGLIDRYTADPVTALAYPTWYRQLHGWLVAAVVVALLVTAALLVLPGVGGYVRGERRE
jgi:hypothetical protein